MAKAVLVTKIGSIYDDLPEERYHFPRQYLGRMEASVGDWITGPAHIPASIRDSAWTRQADRRKELPAGGTGQRACDAGDRP
jgi:hypothetical protein